jgi:hypothetical protein
MKIPHPHLPIMVATLALAFSTMSRGEDKAEAGSPNPFDISQSADVHLTFEFVEVSLADWNDWLAEHPLKSDATELRTTLRTWAKEKRALVFECVTLHARSGQRAKAESIVETTYPVSFEPAQVPQTLSNLHNVVESPVTAIHPQTFETRNVGVTVEVDPVISPDRKSVELNLSPEIVKRIENLPWPNEQVAPAFRAETPQFFTAKITTQLTTKPGAPSLIGTVRLPDPVKDKRENPIILLFVRADIE